MDYLPVLLTGLLGIVGFFVGWYLARRDNKDHQAVRRARDLATQWESLGATDVAWHWDSLGRSLRETLDD